jgi:hypothetical protein
MEALSFSPPPEKTALLSTFRPPAPKWPFFSVSPPETQNKLTRRQPRPEPACFGSLVVRKCYLRYISI